MKHNAATNGSKGERLLREYLQKNGLNLLKVKKDFKNSGFSYDGAISFQSPYDGGTFRSDGFIPELKYIVEFKYGEAHGTTEEKIMTDLEKIRDGVYKSKYPLVYIFWGTPEKAASKKINRCWARIFADKVKKEGLPVEVVFAKTNQGLYKWINQKKQALLKK